MSMKRHYTTCCFRQKKAYKNDQTYRPGRIKWKRSYKKRRICKDHRHHHHSHIFTGQPFPCHNRKHHASICFYHLWRWGSCSFWPIKKKDPRGRGPIDLFHLFKQPKQVKYSDIRCLLLVPLGSRTQMVLVDRQYNRLVTLDYALADLEILFEALLENDIPSVDLGEMTEKGENVSQYINALNVMEKNHYRSIADETKTMESLSEGNEPFHIAGAKKFLKAAGWILILLNAAAFLQAVSSWSLSFFFVLLAAYGIYLWYYPYIYIETTTKKGEQNALQMPVLGPVIAMLLCLSVSKSFDYDLGTCSG